MKNPNVNAQKLNNLKRVITHKKRGILLFGRLFWCKTENNVRRHDSYKNNFLSDDGYLCNLLIFVLYHSLVSSKKINVTITDHVKNGK